MFGSTECHSQSSDVGSKLQSSTVFDPFIIYKNMKEVPFQPNLLYYKYLRHTYGKWFKGRDRHEMVKDLIGCSLILPVFCKTPVKSVKWCNEKQSDGQTSSLFYNSM